MNQLVTPKFGIGAPLRRKEDASLITGTGRYTDDYQPEGCLHAYVLRSSMAHAKITLGDLEDAKAVPGVHLILTAADIPDLKPMPTRARMKQIDGSNHECPPQPVLCSDEVRYVGDAIAFIVADSVNIAKTAAELIEVDYDPLDVVTGIEEALKDGAPLVWPEFGTNKAFTLGHGDADKCAAAFERADKVISITVDNNRLVANYMETRGCVAEYDPETERYTFTAGTQGGHGMRDVICKDILGIDPAHLRLITPEVGGGFGTKMFTYREYPLCLVAAKKLGKPVKWIGERTEHFITDAHGRDNVTTAELALDKDAKILGLKIDVLASMGAYLHQFGPFIPFVGTSMSSGLYDVPALYVTATGVYANMVPTDAYRGAGRPEAAYLIERLIEKAGQETGLGSVEIRRRNFIPKEALPYTTQTGRMYDTGDYIGHMEAALEAADWAGFESRKNDSAARGRYRGIGMCCYIEACAFAGSEEATLELNQNGTVTLLIGTQTNGQGHATAYSQVIAEQLGLDLDSIEVVQGDTDRVKKGGGTGGSRSIPLGLPSVEGASKSLVSKIKDLAANKMEVGAEDLELVGGEVRVVGTDRLVTLAEVAAAAPEKLTGHDEVKQSEATYPNGTHICELEVDPETGDVVLLNYVIVDDFGVTVNPLLLAGQVHGGTAQAISQALCERTVFDEDGQLLTASLLDYRLLRAEDMPEIDFQTRNVPSTTNALGIKGAGEAGTIGGCASVMNALNMALKDGAGVEQIDMPATPNRVWEAIQAAKA
ncbi:xanthine dehydrogenase, molybdenum binding subunit apoprotein [Roseibium hamelinense]|uniref:Xanthine dehydrogenase, molybdenum binding subunit apoprotein n=1 Tax=Roseibium hamelinense TaxID=150831 RepID=A0A562TBR6_9HYPH|nr:xanthine dehydrogenase family protein molybdopterin-binding subunit [Roseibium hamelinense]MTI45313.1 xanthine dehydrogenase family protein molybdopterin-binding subunit [Roseibium hamelinense]TWI90320.1 xanthine dehydrogenase, molybdenum binding subunit apoprotein [Roseibium hamelinense]